ncbi:lysis protein [Pantoea dispersa]|uniref:lysis protein n=1 Tax=Pantoea dispersa TaxID=59814 RepID=UPI0024B85EDF|nr:lysis protein [Pantoea dispersa]MDI9768219.1 lysis protein [Pantoea dispersa]
MMVNFPFSWRTMVIGVLLVILVVACRLASYYHGKYITADSLATELQQTIDDMTVRQRAVAALDEKYTKELASAQATIDQLQRDVASGKRRLQLNATCTKQSATATGVDDAASPGLTDSAERDYFTLRSRIELAGKQIAGLQDYIKSQCMN